jgi:hypothetical protein
MFNTFQFYYPSFCFFSQTAPQKGSTFLENLFTC